MPDWTCGCSAAPHRPVRATSESCLIKGDAEVERAIAGFQRGFSCWRELPAIVVAVVTGHAIGAGFQLALAADLRILTDDAVLVMAEARLGLVPDLGGTRNLVADRGLRPRTGDLCHRRAGRRHDEPNSWGWRTR